MTLDLSAGGGRPENSTWSCPANIAQQRVKTPRFAASPKSALAKGARAMILAEGARVMTFRRWTAAK